MSSIFGNIDDLYLFATVVEEGSLLKASQKLEIPVSTMSRRLSALEERLGTRLLQKQGRNLVATESGRLAYAGISSGMEQLDVAYTNLLNAQAEVSGGLRISLPQNFYRQFVGSVIRDFLNRYPKVSFELVFSQRQAIPETDRDLMMTFDISNMEGMIARPVFKSRNGFYASREYIRKYGEPQSIEELSERGWIGLDSETEIPVYRRGQLVDVLTVKPKLVVNDIVVVIDAVEKGVGVAALPLHHASQSEDLVRILPEFHRSDRQSYIVYRERKHQPKLLTMLVEALLKEAKEKGMGQEPVNP